VFNDYHMGMTAENVAERYGISREASDAYAARSHQLAAKARSEGCFTDQIVPVEIKKKKDSGEFTLDEHVRPNVTPRAWQGSSPHSPPTAPSPRATPAASTTARDDARRQRR
jgi:acetyl-CoA C-acetyltransferase